MKALMVEATEREAEVRALVRSEARWPKHAGTA
jgi:hypothetical protein